MEYGMYIILGLAVLVLLFEVVLFFGTGIVATPVFLPLVL